jgi:1,4-alpha-glucan branching enzyme
MRLNAIDSYSTYLFHQGTNYNSHQLFGAHKSVRGRRSGVRFAVWAPHARAVSVVGDFNQWDPAATPMEKTADPEIWSVWVPGLTEGALYKYAITGPDGEQKFKADPYAFQAELRPKTASVVTGLSYRWHDTKWQHSRSKYCSYDSPMNIYEVHAGSWKQHEDGSFLTYRELADELVPYLQEMHYTHVEFLPLCEYPFDGSWGYQATGYFAATTRYGSPTDLKYLVDKCHQAGIGVLLDWVPGHFCKDDHGLRRFDGDTLYESGSPLLAENKDWGTLNFDYGRPEVRSFLISSALFWLEEYHVDGLRIDAVANMLYLDYGRRDGEWQANRYGGRENLEAVAFLRQLNTAIFAAKPQVLMVAEESTTWPLVSHSVDEGGLGFNYKWNMGWMNDMLRYMSLDPLFRKGNQDLITFSLYYAFAENFILPLSHDEVVHGKGSLLNRMPGDYWKKFAGLRAFYGYWMTHPGKKLLFMGSEFGQFIEWKYDAGLDWLLLDYPMHKGMQTYMRELNAFYLAHRALWQIDFDWKGFHWISCDDTDNSVIAFYRTSKEEEPKKQTRGKHSAGNKMSPAATTEQILVVCNFTPVVRHDYRIGVDEPGDYEEIWDSDDTRYGGSGVHAIEPGTVLASEDVPMHGRSQSLSLTLPPLATVCLQRRRTALADNVPEDKAPAKNVLPEASRKKQPKGPRKPAKAATAKPAANVVIASRGTTK